MRISSLSPYPALPVKPPVKANTKSFRPLVISLLLLIASIGGVMISGLFPNIGAA